MLARMGKVEPYVPPGPEGVVPGGFVATQERYCSTQALVTVLTFLLAAHVVVALGSIGAGLMQVDLIGRIPSGSFDPAEVDNNELRQMLAAVLYGLLLIACGVLVCIWYSRSNRNARALGAQYMVFGPNAWGWFFCPILSLWKPYQAFKELLPATSAGTRLQGIMALWWVFWIGHLVAGNAAYRMVDTEDLDRVAAGTWVGMFDDLLIVGAAIALIAVVRGIHSEQDKLARAWTR